MRVRVTLYGGSYGFSLLSTGSLVYNFLCGTSVVAAMTVTNATSFEQNPTNDFAVLEIYTYADSSTTAQVSAMSLYVPNSDTNTSESRYTESTSTFNSATNQTCVLSAKYNNASLNNSQRMDHAIAEIIK